MGQALLLSHPETTQEGPAEDCPSSASPGTYTNKGLTEWKAGVSWNHQKAPEGYAHGYCSEPTGATQPDLPTLVTLCMPL